MIETLDKLQYSADRKGPWRLYIYEVNSQYHRGGVWFLITPKYPEEEISAAEAFDRTRRARAAGSEVRICDRGDMLVYHAKGDAVLYGEQFFQEIGVST